MGEGLRGGLWGDVWCVILGGGLLIVCGLVISGVLSVERMHSVVVVMCVTCHERLPVFYLDSFE